MFKYRLVKLIEAKVIAQDAKDLQFYLALAELDGLDEADTPSFKTLALATWHEQHEDLVTYGVN
ncbi:MAG TPA: hypothetical protein VHA52_08960 [Candidatus Babeliaceae bacterium]|nr:hypothetical protein [Candidatus Babeliaceae bacterium]